MNVSPRQLFSRPATGTAASPLSRRRSLTVTLGALLLAGTAAAVPSALAATTPPPVPTSPAAYAESSSFGTPTTRALALGLAAPTSSMDDSHPVCAIEVTAGITSCFATADDVSTYLAGNSAPGSETAVHAGGVLPAGLGGTQAGLGGAYQLGHTCLNVGCTVHELFYYTAGDFPCTHSYPYNDYYRDGVPTYSLYFAGPAQQTPLHCSRVVIYRDAVQGGGGAENCPDYNSCSDLSFTFQSISWHLN
jgi:hypothetical protein